MGLMIVQGLAHSPLDELVAIDIEPRRVELARQFGATQTIDASASDVDNRLDELKSLDIDTVVDTSGPSPGSTPRLESHDGEAESFCSVGTTAQPRLAATTGILAALP